MKKLVLSASAISALTLFLALIVAPTHAIANLEESERPDGGNSRFLALSDEEADCETGECDPNAECDPADFEEIMPIIDASQQITPIDITGARIARIFFWGIHGRVNNLDTWEAFRLYRLYNN